MAPNVAERLLTEIPEFAETLRKALRPFRFKATATSGGIGIDGDSVAVSLASRILERIAKMRGTTEQAQLQETIAFEIDYALRHDLVFRLKGMIYPIRPMSLSQVAYMNSLLSQHEQMVIGIGPTGSGKTHLAIAAAISLLSDNLIKQIIVTRPHVLMEGEAETTGSRSETQYDEQFYLIKTSFMSSWAMRATKK